MLKPKQTTQGSTSPLNESLEDSDSVIEVPLPSTSRSQENIPKEIPTHKSYSKNPIPSRLLKTPSKRTSRKPSRTSEDPRWKPEVTSIMVLPSLKGSDSSWTLNRSGITSQAPTRTSERWAPMSSASAIPSQGLIDAAWSSHDSQSYHFPSSNSEVTSITQTTSSVHLSEMAFRPSQGRSFANKRYSLPSKRYRRSSEDQAFTPVDSPGTQKFSFKTVLVDMAETFKNTLPIRTSDQVLLKTVDHKIKVTQSKAPSLHLPVAQSFENIALSSQEPC